MPYSVKIAFIRVVYRVNTARYDEHSVHSLFQRPRDSGKWPEKKKNKKMQIFSFSIDKFYVVFILVFSLTAIRRQNI